jgi:hypothetical protein
LVDETDARNGRPLGGPDDTHLDTARVWQLPAAMDGRALQIISRLQLLTGLGLEERGPDRLLDIATRHKCRQARVPATRPMIQQP